MDEHTEKEIKIMKRVSLKRLEEEVDFIKKVGKREVSVVTTQGCGVYLVIDGEPTKNMSNRAAYERLESIVAPIRDTWLKENGYE